MVLGMEIKPYLPYAYFRPGPIQSWDGMGWAGYAMLENVDDRMDVGRRKSLYQKLSF